jgi:hypothetical protein
VIPPGVELWFCTARIIAPEKFGGQTPGGGALFGNFAYRVFKPHLLVQQLAAEGRPEQLGRQLGRMLLQALVRELGVPRPGAPIPDATLDAAQAKVSAQWAQMGVRFEGFMGVEMR